ncbi:hypothetical protein E4T56_gene977 [Termitomyces sp. T112]|nr:hypothetical protein E4T56_gene977 [Termitomyces sp. T112]KNZ78130.1 hypothetical protein J132_01655 [Termitomyces sp. J132]
MLSPVACSFRSSALRASFTSSRAFRSTRPAKTVTEKVSEVADKVNKEVGKRLASAIEKGEKVTQSTKETLGTAASKSKDKADQAIHEAEQVYDDVGDQAKHTSKAASQKLNQARGTAAKAKEEKEDIQREMTK